MNRFGILLPSSNITVESELIYFQCRSGMSAGLHFYRLDYITGFSQSHRKYSEELCLNVDSAVDSLSKIKDINAYGFFCTTAAATHARFLRDTALRRDVILLDPIRAIGEALQVMKLKTPLVITPYTDEITREILDGITGLSQPAVINLQLLRSREINQYADSGLEKLIKERYDRNLYDSVIVLCTNFPTFQLIDRIETYTESVFISSNLALLWILLKTRDISVPNVGWKLLTAYQ